MGMGNQLGLNACMAGGRDLVVGPLQNNIHRNSSQENRYSDQVMFRAELWIRIQYARKYGSGSAPQE